MFTRLNEANVLVACTNGQQIADILQFVIVKQPAFSHNYFGPCGLQRFEMDPGHTQCVKSVTGTGNFGDPYIVTLASDLDEVFDDDLCRTKGDGGLVQPGIWRVTQLAPDRYELTERKFNAPPPLYDEYATTDLFGKLRWPGAFAIEGRASITSATQNAGNVDLVIEAAPYLRTGDQVDIAGVSGLGANLTVTVTDSSHLTVPGTMAGYPGGGWVTSHGAPDWTWFDKRPKGNFLAFIWQHDYRDTTYISSRRAHQDTWGMPRSVAALDIKKDCLPIKPGNPMVICFSPNGEHFLNGITYPFPGGAAGWDSRTNTIIDAADALKLDGQFGTLWQGLIQTQLDDPLWSRPPMPCVAAVGDETFIGGERIDLHHIQFLEDSGVCSADNLVLCGDGFLCQVYYPNRPQVEAIATMPAGAPALPPGIHINYLTLAELDTGIDPSANGLKAVPPFAGFGGQGGPWLMWEKKLDCATGGGRFATIYAQHIIY